MPLISIVVPCFDEQESLEIFHRETAAALAAMPGVEAEFVFVDDGSRDGTLDVIHRLHQRDPRVRWVSFSRNFGKESAILAGLRHANGDYVALLDADLQDPPSLLPRMYAAVTAGGFDCAAARRTDRDGEGRFRSWASDNFYRAYNAMSRTTIVRGARDFRLMTRQMVDAVLSLTEVNRFTKGIFSWVGFRTTWIEYENVERVAGTTKWSLLQLLRYSIDGFVDFSTAPLAFASALGFVLCAAAIAGVAVIVVRKLVWEDPVQGWTSLACLVLLVGGLQSFTVGIVGQYLARTYLETKRRPAYIVRETEE